MTPLLIRLKHDLKRSTAKFFAECAAKITAKSTVHNAAFDLRATALTLDQHQTPQLSAVCIELKRSKHHAVTIGGLSALSLATCFLSQLPWMYSASAGLWVLGSATHWLRTPQRIRYLIDADNGWYLMDHLGLTPVTYQYTDYCTRNLIVMSFITTRKQRRRVFVWRDAVTPAAFSWLCARMTLGEADVPVQNVATSGLTNIFSFSSRLDS